MNLSEEQKKAFEKMWFIYGNDGKKCTHLNHKLIQGFIEHNEDRREAYSEGYNNMVERFGIEYANRHAATKECFEICDLILSNKISEAIELAKS